MTSWYLLLQKVEKSGHGSRHMLSKVCFKFRGGLSIRYLIGFFKNSILSHASDGALKQYGKERRVFFTAFPIIDASAPRVASDTTSVGRGAAAALIIIADTQRNKKKNKKMPFFIVLADCPGMNTPATINFKQTTCGAEHELLGGSS